MASLLPTRILALLCSGLAAPLRGEQWVAQSRRLRGPWGVSALGRPFVQCGVPQIGDVLLAGVLLCMTWLFSGGARQEVAACRGAAPCRRGRCAWSAAVWWCARILAGCQDQALSVTNVLASRCLSEYDMRNGWRAFDAGLGGSVGAVPVHVAEGLACRGWCGSAAMA